MAINKLLKSSAIERCSTEDNQYVSPIFLVPKPDGSNRFILNLKNFNESIKKEHFKMEDLRTALNLLDKYDFMGRLDLKDAYHLIPIAEAHRKYLRFVFEQELFQFKVLPFGLSSAPLVFTKLCRPVANFLRERGVKLVIYLDDFLIFGASEEECRENINLTVSLLTYLGFVINWEKSELNPTRCLKFLGIIINSLDMSLELPWEKKLKIRDMANQTIKKGRLKMNDLAKLIGVLVAACPAVAYGWLYYKEMESLKWKIGGDIRSNREINLTLNAKNDLYWWLDTILTAKNKIRSDSYDFEIFTDASTTGWGATWGDQKAAGHWDVNEKKMHINFLEIKAAFMGIKCFIKGLYNKQVLLRIDNITALAYINKMGGTKHKYLNQITRELWSWCEARGHWLFAEYVASKENSADEGSRLTNIDTEWQLANFAFNKICESFGKPSIDLFASRINSKCLKYCSWERDPDAFTINSLTISWKDEFWYAFPPFALIPKVLKKIKNENSRGILVVPNWPSQCWFPVFLDLVDSHTLTFNPSSKLLLSPCRNVEHPLAPSLTLVSAIVSGRRTRKRSWERTR